MVKSSYFITCLCLIFFLVSVAEAAEENLKIVTSTGRAAIISDEQIEETRSRALEDALYSAALLGGAEIDESVAEIVRAILFPIPWHVEEVIEIRETSLIDFAANILVRAGIIEWWRTPVSGNIWVRAVL